MTVSNAPPRKLYAILRFAKIRTWATLALVDQHNNRKGEPGENIDKEAPPPIELLGPNGSGDFVASAAALLHELNIPKSTAEKKILAIETVTSASKAWFDNALDADKQEWIRANLEWAKRKFGRGLISAKLHLDEETWHIHFIALPVVQKAPQMRGRKPKDAEKRKAREEYNAGRAKRWTLAYEDVLGGHRMRLSDEQDTYHNAVAHLGLERGEKNPEIAEIHLGDELYIQLQEWQREQQDGVQRPRKSIPPHEYRRIIKQLKREAEDDRARAAAAQQKADAEARRHAAQRDRTAEQIRRMRRKAAADAKMAAKRAMEQAAIAAGELMAAAVDRITEANEREKTAADLHNSMTEAADAIAIDRKQAEADADSARASLASAKAAESAAESARAIAAEQAAKADLSMRQLALVDRAVHDEALALMIDDTARGVSMNENAMTETERQAYRSPWAQLVRTIARTVASALASARNIIGMAQRASNESAGRTARDREALQTERAQVAAAKIGVAQERKSIEQQRMKAAAFVAAWEAVPSDQRSPQVNAAIERATGLKNQAAGLPMTDSGRAKGVSAGTNNPVLGPRPRSGEGR